MNRIEVKRNTTESKMSVVLDFAPLAKNYREKINTPITFLNHMIEHIAWRSGINVEVEVVLDKFLLTHVICEDLGLALGKAVAEYQKSMVAEGIAGYGDAYGIIDEARSHTLISFESRTYCDIDLTDIVTTEEVEVMYKEDLETFLQGFAEGANCTLQIVVEKGENGHHIWEAVFRSLGMALKAALMPDAVRANMTSGVAGNINWEIK